MPNRKYVSETIIGSFEVSFQHRHAEDIGPARELHSHKAELRLNFVSKNDRGLTFVFNQNAQKVLEETFESFFQRDFSGKTFEDVGQELFDLIESDQVMPRLCDKFNQHGFALKEILFDVEFDGTLDHPTQKMHFKISPAPEQA